jgi:hypothetical protein
MNNIIRKKNIASVKVEDVLAIIPLANVLTRNQKKPVTIVNCPLKRQNHKKYCNSQKLR